jgi:hypothetical protein
VLTPPLANAPPCQGGTHFARFGVFLTPLKAGSHHTFRFQGVLDGVAVLAISNQNLIRELGRILPRVQVIPSRAKLLPDAFRYCRILPQLAESPFD